MTRRCLMIAVVLVAVWMMPRPTSAQTRPTATTPAAQPVFSYTAQQRRAIREMPMVQRPDRVGHFYGNAVRRRHRRGR